MASNSEDFNLSGPVHMMRRAIDWSNAHHRTTIAASLVQGVYVMERDRAESRKGLQALAPPWWDSFNFQLLEEFIDASNSSIFGAVYKFKNPVDSFREVPHPPRYVIALRGTVLKPGTVWQDFKLNLKLSLKQKLDCGRVEKALESVRERVDDAGAGAKNVWLAGHSLGSAIALVVGRNMVIEKKSLLETYLFNPPYISVPLEQIKNPTLKSWARMVGSAAKVLAFKLTTDHQQRAQVKEKFNQLSGWTPYLCVNENDPICSEYIGYFANRNKMERLGAARIGSIATTISTTSIIKSVSGHNAEPFHLLPTAYLVINKSLTESKKCVPKKYLEAHGVAQWWTTTVAGPSYKKY